MRNAVLEKLIEERQQVQSAAVAIAESEDFNPDDKTYTELRNSATDLDHRITSLADLLEQQSSADALDARLAKASKSQQQRQVDVTQTRTTLGQSFIDSDQFRGYGMRGTSSRVDLEDEQSRALPTSVVDLVAAGLKGTVAQIDTTPAPAPTPLMDNINQVQVSGNSIEFISWAKIAGGAAVVAEEATKPSAEFGPTITPAVLETVAVWTQLTRQMVEDYATVRSYIDGELTRDVARTEETLAATVLAGAAAAIPNATSTVNLLSAIRVGIGTVQAAGYNPGAVLLNPADWAALDVGVMADTLNGPVVRQNFWGLTVIPSTAQAAGTAIVGDFRTAMTRFYRSGISLYVTDSHASTFTANVFTLLAERRSKSVVVRPQALAECTKV